MPFASVRTLLSTRRLAGAACAAIALAGCALEDEPAQPAVAVPRPARADAVIDAATNAAIDAAVTASVRAGRLPGAAVHVERGARVHEHAVGRTGTGARSAMATVYDAAELTEALATAPAILLMVEQGRLALDAPLVRYMPECAGGGREAITIRHLLTHTAGLPYRLPARLPDGASWHGNAQAHALACSQALDAQPGTRYRYSHVGGILLGQLVERVTGAPLDAFVQARLFAPLRMRDTGFLPLRRIDAARIAPVGPDNGQRGIVFDEDARRMGGVAGSAGLFTTAGDVARFARMLLAGGVLDGVRVLREDSVRLLTTAQSPPDVREARGLGMDIGSPAAARARGGLSEDSHGHTGATGCVLWIDPAANTFYVLLSNRAGADLDDVPAVADRLATLLAPQAEPGR